MKKTLSITAALGLALSMTAVAAADSANNTETTQTTTTTTTSTPTTPVVESRATVTTSIYLNIEEPIIKADEVVLNPTESIQITKKTYLYDMPNGKTLGALAPQKIDTTGTPKQTVVGGEWVEIYTWLGKAWIFVGSN